MKSFPYFEFIVFIMPGGYFIGWLYITLGFHGLEDLLAFNGLSSSMEILFFVSLAMIMGHFLGWVSNGLERVLWRGRSYNYIVKVGKNRGDKRDLKTEYFKQFDQWYFALEAENKLHTITKLYAQARFAQNIMIANLMVLIVHLILYLALNNTNAYVSDTRVKVTVVYLLLSSVFCLILFLNRDRIKVNKVYTLGALLSS